MRIPISCSERGARYAVSFAPPNYLWISRMSLILLRRYCLALVSWVLIAGYIPTAQSTVALSVTAEGLLTGASGVVVGGRSYSVSFLDGSCFSLFSGCSASSFEFQSYDSAKIANQALLDQVFLDVPLGQFDSRPELTVGCSDPIRCYVNTPYFLEPNGLVVYLTSLVNYGPAHQPQDNTWGGSGEDVTLDLTSRGSATYAVWLGEPTTSTVPEPKLMTLLGTAGFALSLALRRRRASRK